MPKTRTNSLIAKLAAGVDLDRALKELRITPHAALLMLSAGYGKRQIAERRALAKIHAHLVAHRYSTFAVHRLCELLQSDKPELRLKGAISVLNIAGLAKAGAASKRHAKQKASAGGDENLTPAEHELIEALAAVMTQRKKEN